MYGLYCHGNHQRLSAEGKRRLFAHRFPAICGTRRALIKRITHIHVLKKVHSPHFPPNNQR